MQEPLPESKCENRADATSLCTEILTGTQLSSFEGLGRNSDIRCCEKRHETSAARNKGGQQQNGPPDSNPVGLLQDGLRRILDTWCRRHCSVFVLGPFCSISHGSTLRRKGWINPTIPSQFFAFVLVRGGCGRGASALPLNASESSLTAS